MKKTNTLFMIWGVIVVIILILLTILGFMIKGINIDYRELENKLQLSAEKYTSDKFLYPEEGEIIRVSKDDLVKSGYLDNLEKDKDICDGYVEVLRDDVVKYKAYIKCKKYTTDGYQKNKD